MGMRDLSSGVGRMFEVFIVVGLLLLMFIAMSMCTGLVALPFYLVFRNKHDRRKLAFWVAYFTVLPFIVSLFLFVDFYLDNGFLFLLASFLGALCYVWMRKDAGLSVLSSED